MIRASGGDDHLILTLDRPDKANALTADMLAALSDAVEGSKAKVITITGEGRVFSAGADLDAARAGLATSPLWERLSGAIADHSALTIAALNGTVAGGAMGMVLACDLRVAVAGAKFFYPVMKLGFLPQPSDPKRMTSLIGSARAKMILMAGQKIDAQTALGWGLIDAIADGDAVSHVRELAQDALSADVAHIAGIKALF